MSTMKTYSDSSILKESISLLCSALQVLAYSGSEPIVHFLTTVKFIVRQYLQFRKIQALLTRSDLLYTIEKQEVDWLWYFLPLLYTYIILYFCSF